MQNEEFVLLLLLANKAIGSIATRYFRHNLGTIDEAQMGSPAVLGSVFGIEVDVLSYAGEGMILGSSVTSDYLWLRADGQLRFRGSDGVVQSTPSGVYTFGRFNTVSVQQDGGILSIDIDGVEVLAVASTTECTLNLLYRYGGGIHFPGVLANARLSTVGVPVHEWVINEPSGATIFDSIGSNNASIINGFDADRGLFVEKPTLWKGQGLAVPPWDSIDQELLKA